jgi:hypothetical protein
MLQSLGCVTSDTSPPLHHHDAGDSNRRRARTDNVAVYDLIGTTAVASRIDKNVRDDIRSYHKCCRTYHKCCAHIVRFDCVMVHFGYSKAHEDDTDRPLWCGLKMIQAR